MKSGLTVKFDLTKDLDRALRELVRDSVLVGVPAAEAEREPAPGEPATLNNAALAYIHDKGSPAANIPARPFMEPGIIVAEDAIEAIYSKAAKGVLDNPTSAASIMSTAHNKVGLTAQDAIQSKIEAGIEPGLSERTMADRRRRFGVDATETPLIESGQMKAAITYVTRPNRKRR